MVRVNVRTPPCAQQPAPALPPLAAHRATTQFQVQGDGGQQHSKQTGLIRCTLVIIVRRSPVIDMSEHSWLRGLLCCPKSPPSSPHPWSGLQLSSSSERFLLDLCECLASRSGASDATWIRSLFCETSEKRTGAKMHKNWKTW